MAKNTKNTAKKPVSTEIPVSGTPTGEAGALTHEPKAYAILRDRRGSGGLGILDQSTERLYRNCLYPEKVTFRNYYDMYSRNNVAARVIETFPDYTWNVMPTVTDRNGPKSRFSKSVTALLNTQIPWQDGLKQSLFTSLKQLDVLGGIGGESLLVYGFADGGKLETPVKKTANCRISWVKVLHNGQFQVDKREENEDSPNYGDAVLYKTLAFNNPQESNFANHIAPGKLIHASRCVHFKESVGLPYGISRIQKCYNQLLDIVKLSGASAEVYWLGAFSGLAVETDPNATLGEESREAMKEEVKKYFDGLARSLMFEGAKAKLLYPAIVSPKEHFELQITMISIATAVPRRFLTGAEAAKLASQQDTLNWMERVMNRRDNFIGPKVVVSAVQRCIDAGVLAEPKGDELNVTWPRTQSIALNERAVSARNMTEAVAKYLSSGMSEVMPFREYLINIAGYSETEAEELDSVSKIKKWKIVRDSTNGGKAVAQPAKETTEKETTEKEDGGDKATEKDSFDLEEYQNEVSERLTELENKAARLQRLVEDSD